MNVLLFDIDGTLIDAGGAGQAAMESALAREFHATRPVQGIPTAGRTDRAIGRDLFRYYAIPTTESNWSRYREAYFSLLPHSLQERGGQILPGVTHLMNRLRHQENVFLGLLTGNFEEGARLKLQHYRLDSHFKMGGFGDHDLERDDVARAVFSRLRTDLPDIDPADIWVIGDTPSDVKCGRAIGAKTLAVATGVFDMDQLALSQADVLLSDLTQADDWLCQFL
ncbi:MAG: HAD family hydrolase [Planctomycetales bacterium]|jgi:phosphoglycolate phosphatase|nr:HAD family hydrolase [Planctomycetales bacterium]